MNVVSLMIGVLTVALAMSIIEASRFYREREAEKTRADRAEAALTRLQARPSSITVTVGPSLPPSIATRDGWSLDELEGGL